MRYGLDKPLRLVQPSTCAWCGGSLRLLRHTYRGKDSHDEYCSEKCLKRGLERVLAYKAALAGTVNSPWYLVLAALLLVFVIGFVGTPRARAEDHKHHSPFHDFYKEWKQPGTTASCCNARFNEQGEEVGDCEVSQFELRKDGWYAYVPMIQQTIRVPDAKIIREKNPDYTGRDGHICYNKYSGVLCAVPPTGSM